MRTILVLFVMSFMVMLPAGSALSEQATQQAPAAAAAAEKCEHGVKKSLCTRCNPKLQAVFKAKGDWCEEHGLPESQCVQCHPELGKQGIK